MVNALALFVALSLSVVSAYYSIIGLTTLFASAFYPVIFMGVVLEAGKLVTTSWLHQNWDTSPKLLRAYLTSAVVVLMIISSIGIFGFLSKAHIEHTISLSSGSSEQIQILNQQIEAETKRLDDVSVQIQQIDSALSKMTDRGQALSSLRAGDQQRKTRENLDKKREEHAKNISQYKQARIKLQSEVRKLEAEVGPLKYIAELIYDKDDNDQLEKAVRIIILILVSVFDPLAILLLIAASEGMKRNRLTLSTKPIIIDDIIHNVLNLGDTDVTARKTNKE
jgi:hypothetical protein